MWKHGQYEHKNIVGSCLGHHSWHLCGRPPIQKYFAPMPSKALVCAQFRGTFSCFVALEYCWHLLQALQFTSVIVHRRKKNAKKIKTNIELLD
jgi:hypothetical protein